MHLITFHSSKFDVTKETPNPINPIFGESVLHWLRGPLRSVIETGEPAPEDWGWYIDGKRAGTIYLIGASAEPDESSPLLEWKIQIHRHRSMKDRFTGANKMSADDPVTARIAELLRADPEIREIELEVE